MRVVVVVMGACLCPCIVCAGASGCRLSPLWRGIHFIKIKMCFRFSVRFVISLRVDELICFVRCRVFFRILPFEYSCETGSGSFHGSRLGSDVRPALWAGVATSASATAFTRSLRVGKLKSIAMAIGLVLSLMKSLFLARTS